VSDDKDKKLKKAEGVGSPHALGIPANVVLHRAKKARKEAQE
jgi:hypothetical protein